MRRDGGGGRRRGAFGDAREVGHFALEARPGEGAAQADAHAWGRGGHDEGEGG